MYKRERKIVGNKIYRKWKSPDGYYARHPEDFKRTGKFIGIVHLQYKRLDGSKSVTPGWFFVCGKRRDSYCGVPTGRTEQDDAIVTCSTCMRRAPEVVEQLTSKSSHFLGYYQDPP